MTNIKKIAVLGSGVMGSGIAAHIAASGTPVVLLDIVPAGAENRNILTENAVKKQLDAKPSGFVHPKVAKLITCGNLEDNLEMLADCDWIIEAVLERLDVKQDVYRKIDSVRKSGSVVSSNTSTLPLGTLTEGFSDVFKSDFMITHFFNPPRFMRLLEVAGTKETHQETITKICDFADKKLGKTPVHCKDTAGFIANRIGVYWMMLGLLEAIRLGVSPEEADAAMGKPVGFPSTGIFGLFDLIGIDLMPLIAKAMLSELPETDAFRKAYSEPALVTKMIADGYTGRKGKGGFYRMVAGADGKKNKEVINLKTGQYAPVQGKIDIGKIGIAELIASNEYARAVLVETLHYAASLIPEIADDISAVDEAMKLGYSWKFGAFELIDKIGVDNFIGICKAQGLDVPAILAGAAGGKMYSVAGTRYSEIGLNGEYKPIIPPAGSLMLADIKLAAKSVLKNASASVWDIGDGIACLEFTSKMNSIDPDILSMMEQAIGAVKQDFKGLVIGGDSDNFSVGANLSFMLMAANIAAWKQIEDILKAGQQAMMSLKYSPFPVVSSLAGMALGGGCETILHSNAVQAHIESYAGLVEVGVGLIPSWGGCKEILIRHGNASNQAFEIIAKATPSSSAMEAKDTKILRDTDGISMNRIRVLADAKAKCLSMADNYESPKQQTLHLAGETAKIALFMAIDGYKAAGKATEHDVVVTKVLAEVLTGGNTDLQDEMSEQQILDLERAGFMELIKTKGTIARIEYMLQTGKPLRN